MDKKDGEGSKSKPVRIHIEDVDHKRRWLSRGKKLKEVQDEGLKNVCLTPNLTKMQQEEEKKCDISRAVLSIWKTSTRPCPRYMLVFLRATYNSTWIGMSCMEVVEWFEFVC